MNGKGHKDDHRSSPMFHVYYQSPLGLVEIGGHASAVTSLNFVETKREGIHPGDYLQEALNQVQEYFQKKRQTFDLNLDPQGTPFQRMVWDHLQEIPYGKTVSYRSLAEQIGRPRAQRAVGAANGQNPISLIIPCHRLVGSNQRLTGYGGGLWRKAWLLEHEGAGSFRP